MAHFTEGKLHDLSQEDVRTWASFKDGGLVKHGKKPKHFKTAWGKLMQDEFGEEPIDGQDTISKRNMFFPKA